MRIWGVTLLVTIRVPRDTFKGAQMQNATKAKRLACHVQGQ